ncbi:MAG TPA: extracellular solute-binding protein [Gemmataceae bacterium]
MQWKRWHVWFLFCITVWAACIAGCQRTPPSLSVPTPPHQGIELRVACPTEATAALLRERGQPWALRQGVKLVLVRPDSARTAELPDAASADVWIIPPSDLPRWAADGRLAAVPDKYTTRESPYAWPDVLPLYREQLIVWEDAPRGLPLIGESPVCCYRTDLLEAPAHQTALSKLLGGKPTAPVTWEQFAQLAEYFREHGADGRPGPSLPPLPRDDAELDRLFYTIAAAFARRAVAAGEPRRAGHQDDVFSFHYDLKTGEPRISAPGFVHALKLLKRLQPCRPAEPAERPEEAFRAGRAALCLSDAPWVKTFQETPDLHDKVGVCPVPGGDRYFEFDSGKAHPAPEGNRVPYLGGAGWLAVVPRASPHADAAFDLLAELSGPETSKQVFLSATRFGGPLRGEQLYRHRWDSFDLPETQTLQLQKALQEALLHRGLKNPALCLRTPRQAAHRAALVKEVRAALRQDTDAEKALQNVAEAWKKLDREQGVEKHRADYRRSLGLLARN